MQFNDNVEMEDQEADKGDHMVQEVGLNQEHTVFSESEVKKFREFSKRRDCMDLLIDSLAPSIWENNDVKKGILT